MNTKILSKRMEIKILKLIKKYFFSFSNHENEQTIRTDGWIDGRTRRLFPARSYSHKYIHVRAFLFSENSKCVGSASSKRKKKHH